MNENYLSAERLGERFMALEAQQKVQGLFRTQAASIKLHEVPNLENEEMEDEEVINTKKGLCAIDSNKRVHLLWRCGIKSITRHEYPSFTGWSSCYCILTNDDKIITLFDSQIGPKQSLKDMLSHASGVEVKKYRSEKKTNELLMEFLKQNSTVYSYPLHGGWLFRNDQWHFILQNQKTHFDDQATSTSFSDYTSYPINGCAQEGFQVSSVHGYFHYLQNALDQINDDWTSCTHH